MADDGSQSPRIPVRLRDWVELNRRVAELSNDVLTRLEAIEKSIGSADSPVGAKVWYATVDGGDWVPNRNDQWIGDGDQQPRGLSVGRPTGIPGAPGLEGVITERGQGTEDDGIVIMGFRNQAIPDDTPYPGTLANAPLELAGAPVVIAGNSLYIQVSTVQMESHYMLFGASATAADGRHYSPVILGPRYVPELSELFSEATDYDLDLPAVVLAGGTLTQSYVTGDTVLYFQIALTEESANQTSAITVELWANLATVGSWAMYSSEEFLMGASSRFDVERGIPVLTQTLATGDQVELRVSAVKGNPNSDPWVRGSLAPSQIEIRQG